MTVGDPRHQKIHCWRSLYEYAKKKKKDLESLQTRAKTTQNHYHWYCVVLVYFEGRMNIHFYHFCGIRNFLPLKYQRSESDI